MEQKRVLLAVILSFIVLYGYQALFPPPKPQPKPSTAVTGAVPPAEAGGAPATPPAAAPAAPSAAAVLADTEERDVTFENDSVPLCSRLAGEH